MAATLPTLSKDQMWLLACWHFQSPDEAPIPVGTLKRPDCGSKPTETFKAQTCGSKLADTFKSLLLWLLAHWRMFKHNNDSQSVD